MGVENATPAPTPGTTFTKEEAKAYEESALMSNPDASAFRGLAARLNYLGLDRADLQYAAKEVAKRMAAPREADWARLKRVARYLVGAPRLIQKFGWQDLPAELHTFTDSDWAGDKETRKSTSGGAITWGSHTLKTWSTTQHIIALSSGEAKLYALVMGAAQSHGLAAMLDDFSIQVSCAVCTDAAAAIGMVHRRGLGRTRHIEVQYLWIQQHVAEERLHVARVGTDSNPADMLTKHLKAETVNAHLQRLGFEQQYGRDMSAPWLMAATTQPATAATNNNTAQQLQRPSRRQLRRNLRQQQRRRHHPYHPYDDNYNNDASDSSAAEAESAMRVSTGPPSAERRSEVAREATGAAHEATDSLSSAERSAIVRVLVAAPRTRTDTLATAGRVAEERPCVASQRCDPRHAGCCESCSCGSCRSQFERASGPWMWLRASRPW